jgi:hypothetical protein
MNDETIIELYWMRSEMAIKNTEESVNSTYHFEGFVASYPEQYLLCV